VLAVVGILATIATANYRSQLLASQRALAVAELYVLRSNQELYRLRFGRHATNMAELGRAGQAYAIDARGRPVDVLDDTRLYVFTLSLVEGGFVLSAIPQLRQSEDTLCGELRLTSLGVRSVGGSGNVEGCW